MGLMVGQSGSVYGIEYVKPLVSISLQNLHKIPELRKLVLTKNIVISHGDGWQGLKEVKLLFELFYDLYSMLHFMQFMWALQQKVRRFFQFINY
jgi:hypothetical protein